MPVVKSAYMRFQIIDACLTNKHKRYWTMQELINKLADADLNVERRTVEGDIESMRYDERLGFHAPIAYCRKNKGFHYMDADYSIGAIPLTEQDVQALTFAANILQQYKGARVVNQFEGAL